jgi:cytosine/adenosine deaminase-related metal-dependent hydrolase
MIFENATILTMKAERQILVRSAVGSDVDTVVIDGRVVMQGREMLTLDKEAIVEEVRRRYRAVAQRAGIEQSGSSWPVV